LRALGKVGHIRVYSALAASLTVALLAIGLTDSWVPWMLLRFITGVCFAGQYVVAESWLNELGTNQNRGRLLGVYSLVVAGAFAAGQSMLFAFDGQVVAGFSVAAILASLAVIPVTLSEEAVAPSIGESEHISMRELARIVPTGLLSCLLIGIAHGVLGGLPAVYATRAGYPVALIGLFAAAPGIGGMLLQWPISAASDDLDRRAVGLAASVGALALALVLVLTPEGHWMAIVWFGVLGALILSMVLGSRREKKKFEQMMSSIKKNDQVRTVGGIIGSVVEVKPDVVILKVDENSNTKITVARGKIEAVMKESAAT
jgi:preprotein translocase YajC subunit